MPEGPELAVSRDRLRQILIGKSIISLNVGPAGRFLKKYPEGYDRILNKLSESPARIEGINTKGKFMWWSLSFPDDLEMWYMYCTYGMSAQWELNRSKHTAFSIVASDHVNLFFNDQRHFGTIKFVRGRKDLDKKLRTLGPCILGEEISLETFKKNILKKPQRPICEGLMDQSGVSGIGNYMRAEMLYGAGIDPWRMASSLSAEEWNKLYLDAKRVATHSYLSQGASMYTYKNVDGTNGNTQFAFKVYGLNHDENGHEILRKEDSNGRTVHWCPKAQN